MHGVSSMFLLISEPPVCHTFSASPKQIARDCVKPCKDGWKLVISDRLSTVKYRRRLKLLHIEYKDLLYCWQLAVQFLWVLWLSCDSHLLWVQWLSVLGKAATCQSKLGSIIPVSVTQLTFGPISSLPNNIMITVCLTKCKWFHTLEIASDSFSSAYIQGKEWRPSKNACGLAARTWGQPLQHLTKARFFNIINRRHILCKAMGNWICEELPPFRALEMLSPLLSATSIVIWPQLQLVGFLMILFAWPPQTSKETANLNCYLLPLAITVLWQIAWSSLLTCLSSSTAKPKYCQIGVPNFAASSIQLPTYSLVTSPQSRWLTDWLCVAVVAYALQKFVSKQKPVYNPSFTIYI